MSDPEIITAEPEVIRLEELPEVVQHLSKPRPVPASPWPGPSPRPAAWPPAASSKARR